MLEISVGRVNVLFHFVFTCLFLILPTCSVRSLCSDLRVTVLGV